MPFFDRIPDSLFNTVTVVCTAFFVAAGQIFWKVAAQRIENTGPHGFMNLSQAIFSASFIIGVVFYLAGVAFWLLLLSRLPLTKAFTATTGLVYLAAIFADFFLFSNPISVRTLLGGGCVIFGIVLTLT